MRKFPARENFLPHFGGTPKDNDGILVPMLLLREICFWEISLCVWDISHSDRDISRKKNIDLETVVRVSILHFYI